MKWERTANLNKYTGRPNIVYTSGGWHAVVYMRQYGYAFTVRAQLASGHWLQESSSTSVYYTNIEEAKGEALLAMDDISERFVGAIIIRTKTRRHVDPEICRMIGLSENYHEGD